MIGSGLGLGLQQMQGFDPSHLGGVKAWWRADRGVVADTGVGTWKDLTGHGHDLTQGTSTRQPNLVTSASYGNQKILSATITQFLSCSTWLAAIAQPYTIFLVGDCNNSLFYAYDGVNDEASVDNSGTGWRLVSGASNFTATATTTTPAVLIVVVNGASSKIYVSQATPTTGTAGALALDQAAIFGRQDGAGTGTGHCAEAAIISRALTSQEITILNAYANRRYGITIGA